MADLLEEMIDGAIRAETPLADLLRQCMVLAHRLELDEFKTWVNFELNGYQKKEDLPDYRVRPASSYGNFGNGVYFYNKQPISIMMIPEKFRDQFRTIDMSESVGSIERHLASPEQGATLKARWSPEYIRLIGPQLEGIADTYQLHDAWQEVSGTFPQEILETVRNRVIEFVLEVQRMFGTIEKIKKEEMGRSEDQIRQVFNFTIMGDNKGNVAAVQQDVQNQIVNIERGNIGALRSHLKGLGIADEDIDELESAIKEDQVDPENESKSLGSRVMGWFGKLSSNVASGALTNLTVDALPSVIGALQQCLL